MGWGNPVKYRSAACVSYPLLLRQSLDELDLDPEPESDDVEDDEEESLDLELDEELSLAFLSADAPFL